MLFVVPAVELPAVIVNGLPAALCAVDSFLIVESAPFPRTISDPVTVRSVPTVTVPANVAFAPENVKAVVGVEPDLITNSPPD